MSVENEKATAFVSRLLQNPALRGYTSLQREEQIIQFLHVNSAQLSPTLSSQQFFPGKNWNRIFTLLLDALYGLTDTELLPAIEKQVKSVNYTFIQLLRQQQANDTLVKSRITKIVTDLMQKPDARRGFTGPFSAIEFDMVNKYLDESFSRKTYIHFELTKVQRLRMGKEEVQNFIDVTLLLKPVINMISSNTASQQERTTGMVQSQFAEKVFGLLQKQLKILPEQVLKSAVDASLSFNENRFVEATSRLAAIFSARNRNYQPHMRVDRGADSPDKSWFSIARRNYKFYGFDIKMLDELYKIAAENNW